MRLGLPQNSRNPVDISGWTHTGTQGDALLWAVGYSDGSGSITVAGHGNQFVTMGGGDGISGTSGWQQTLAGLTPGASYVLTFDMASEGTFSGPQSITVDFPLGSRTAPVTFTAATSPVNYWRDWEEKTMTFVASASSATLRFSATTVYDVGLDYVRVVSSAVPEPSSLILYFDRSRARLPVASSPASSLTSRCSGPRPRWSSSPRSSPKAGSAEHCR